MRSGRFRSLLLRLGLDLETAPLLSDEERAAVRGIETIVIALGSYRNLTSMTAAIFALHPAAIVLNHAWIRLGTKPSLDFFRDPRPERVQAFLAAAVHLAQSGRAGDYGGSILQSHVFHRPEVKRLYDARYGGRIIKSQPRTLFWKESMRVLNHIWKNRIDLSALTDSLPQIRFLRFSSWISFTVPPLSIPGPSDAVCIVRPSRPRWGNSPPAGGGSIYGRL